MQEAPASEASYQLTSDPTYYVMAGVFALLTTALPSAIGQPLLMPLLQAVVLTVFVAIPVRSGHWKQAIAIMAIWIVLQVAVVTSLTLWSAEHMERSFRSGFGYRTDVLAWMYGAADAPEAWQPQAGRWLAGSLAFAAGSLATAGFIGNWFLVHTTGMAAFTFGISALASEGPLVPTFAVAIWYLLRIAGTAGLVILLSEPLLTGNWSPRFYWTQRRVLLVASLTLLGFGAVFSLVL